MKKLLLMASLLALSFQPVLAVKAKPGVVKTVKQADGTELQVKLVGDEHFHYYTNLDDKPLWMDESGKYRVVEFEKIQEMAYEKAALREQKKSQALKAAAASQGSWVGVGRFGELFPHTGKRNSLIILVAFEDQPFIVNEPHDYFTRFLNEERFKDHGGTGSVKDYFEEVSMGQFEPTFDVYGPVTLSTMATYGKNDRWGQDENPTGMVVDACKALDGQINFADYDTDGDGVVDNIYIIYAGYGEATYGSEDTIWPHSYDIRNDKINLVLDGVQIGTYGCSNEWENGKPDGIGTFCHEFGHVLGLPDLYNTVTTSANYTPGPWDVMDAGSYNHDSRTPPSYSAFERNAMGWIDLIELKPGMEVELREINGYNEAAILPISNTEFFLFENRQKTRWDGYLPATGMLVWHIKYNSLRWGANTVNNTKSQQYVDIEEAGGVANSSIKRTLESYPFPGSNNVTTISDYTTPNLLTWDKKETGIIIYDIAETKGVISFKVGDTAGIADATINASGEEELYNLQGVRVNGNPAPGIYISRNGNEVKKVIIRN